MLFVNQDAKRVFFVCLFSILGVKEQDAKPGITMPPFHCHCRSTTVPYIEGLLDDGGRVARDPETGKTVEIPDMTYEEWYNKYVVITGDYQKLIGIVADNHVEIKSITKHATDRAIERKILYTDAKDAIINPVHIYDVTIDKQGRKSQKFLGQRATTVINPDTGALLSVYKTSMRRLKNGKRTKFIRSFY